jgi:hypothetical protein
LTAIEGIMEDLVEMAETDGMGEGDGGEVDEADEVDDAGSPLICPSVPFSPTQYTTFRKKVSSIATLQQNSGTSMISLTKTKSKVWTFLPILKPTTSITTPIPKSLQRSVSRPLQPRTARCQTPHRSGLTLTLILLSHALTRLWVRRRTWLR